MENQEYNEISLRELIENLIKNKKLILIIVAIILILVSVYTFVLVDRIYEGKAVVQVNLGEVNRVQAPDDVVDVLDGLSIYSYTSLEAYKEQLISTDVMMRVKSDLKLNNMTVEQLRRKISIQNSKDSNLITIAVKDSNPVNAADIANSIAEQFSLYIGSIQEKQLMNSTSILESQLAIEKEKLDSALEELQVLLSESRDTVVLESEIESTLNILNRYKNELVTLETDYYDKEFQYNETIRACESKVLAYEELLKTINKNFVVDKSILDDTFATQLASSLSSNLSQIMKLKISDEEVNPVYVENLSLYIQQKVNILNAKEALVSLKNNYDYKSKSLNENIGLYEGQIDALKIEFAEREIEERIVQRKVSTAQTTYDAFSDKLEVTRVASAAKVSENNIVTVSKAIEPNEPISPNKALNLAIGLVLGLMVGVFVAFFKEYWKNSSSDSQS